LKQITKTVFAKKEWRDSCMHMGSGKGEGEMARMTYDLAGAGSVAVAAVAAVAFPLAAMSCCNNVDDYQSKAKIHCDIVLRQDQDLQCTWSLEDRVRHQNAQSLQRLQLRPIL
jgi:hypothetical protein